MHIKYLKMSKSKEKTDVIAKMTITMSTDYLMGGIDEETYITNSQFSAKKMKDDYNKVHEKKILEP